MFMCQKENQLLMPQKSGLREVVDVFWQVMEVVFRIEN